MEEWRDVPGYEGLYEVSDLGKIKSLARPVRMKDGRVRFTKTRLLKLVLRKDRPDARYQITLSRDGVISQKYIHQLVLLAFIGPCPEGMEVCHNNGDGLDNLLGNLRYDTPKSNQHDKIAHGTTNRGVRHGMSKLTAQNVFEIREKYAAGNVLQRELGAIYGVNGSTISDIIQGRAWGHI